ncbi:MAG TPA: sulfurtransferase TusA family protein [Polyangiaceae bacterium]
MTHPTLLDARGQSCPLPIVLVAKAIKTLSVGNRIVVSADDRAFVPDIQAWCRKTGHELVSIENRSTHVEATIQKR